MSRDQADEIGRNITLDQGKPLYEAIGEVKSCADHADWHAEECRRIYGRIIPPRQPNVRQMVIRSEEHTSELQSRGHLVCRLLLEKKKIIQPSANTFMQYYNN